MKNEKHRIAIISIHTCVHNNIKLINLSLATLPVQNLENVLLRRN